MIVREPPEEFAGFRAFLPADARPAGDEFARKPLGDAAQCGLGQWLAANASSYGFYNLPSEPWHWSTTGN